MKRIFVFFTTLLFAVTLSAQGNISLLDKVAGNRAVFDYRYLISEDGKPFHEVTSGSVTVEDNAFRLTGLNLEIISDGTTRWSMDPEAKEVLIERVEKDNIFTNPAILISSYRDHLDMIKVKSSGSDSLDAVVTFDDRVKGEFILKNVKFLPKGDKKDFTLDVKSLEKGFVVTDLR
ncbi:MAG: hypothetical protein J6T02_03725 [Bacteroidales bacterium]|nr:hypothetical protein [Bacteroidales bacterium]